MISSTLKSIPKPKLFIPALTRWYFTHGSRMPSVPLVAVGALYKNARIAETLREHLPADVVQADSLADVPAGLLDHLVAVHVGQQPEAESGKKRS